MSHFVRSICSKHSAIAGGKTTASTASRSNIFDCCRRATTIGIDIFRKDRLLEADIRRGSSCGTSTGNDIITDIRTGTGIGIGMGTGIDTSIDMDADRNDNRIDQIDQSIYNCIEICQKENNDNGPSQNGHNGNSINQNGDNDNGSSQNEDNDKETSWNSQDKSFCNRLARRISSNQELKEWNSIAGVQRRRNWLAAQWALKEAVFKSTSSLHTDDSHNAALSFRDISIKRISRQRPQVTILDDRFQGYAVDASLSHDGDYIVAAAVTAPLCSHCCIDQDQRCIEQNQKCTTRTHLDSLIPEILTDTSNPPRYRMI